MACCTESLERLPKRRRLEAPAQEDKQSAVQPSSQADIKPGDDHAVAPAAAGNDDESKDQGDATASRQAGGLDQRHGAAKEGNAWQASSHSNAAGSNLQQKQVSCFADLLIASLYFEHGLLVYSSARLAYHHCRQAMVTWMKQ
jgi:hypothetical protein